MKNEVEGKCSFKCKPPTAGSTAGLWTSAPLWFPFALAVKVPQGWIHQPSLSFRMELSAVFLKACTCPCDVRHPRDHQGGHDSDTLAWSLLCLCFTGPWWIISPGELREPGDRGQRRLGWGRRRNQRVRPDQPLHDVLVRIKKIMNHMNIISNTLSVFS